MFARLFVAAVCVLCAAGETATAQGRGRQGGAPPPQLQSGETYLWHGELVSLDSATRALTVRTRLLRQAATDVERLNPGDRILLRWSGQDTHAGVVRRVTRHNPAERVQDFFALPVELVSRDVSGDQITVRVRVPEASMGAIKGLKPTEWVTVMARQRPASDAEAIAVVSGYVKAQN